MSVSSEILIVQMIGRSPSNTIPRAALMDDNDILGAVMLPTAHILGGGVSMAIYK